MAKYYDTMLWEYLKNPWQKWLSLDDLSKKYFNYEMISYEEVTEKKTLNFCEVKLKKASEYSGEDVYITNKLYQEQKKQHISEDTVLNDLENPLLLVLKDMEITGVKIDIPRLSEVWKLLESEIEKEKQMVFQYAGEDFNIHSPKQVGEILFDKLWLPTAKKTKTGYSVDNEVLESLAFHYPIAKHITLYRQYTKLYSTYVEGLSKLVDPKTSKIHTSYNQTVTTTGRLSSTNPNLQNIPSSSSGLSSEIRKAFIPFSDDDFIVTFDYSQIEVRLLALMSEDENLLSIFQSWADIHASTGYFLFGKENISKEERKIAKAVNFWVIYGISAFWLSKMIGIPQSEAKEYIQIFYEKYPKVAIFFDRIIKNCEKNWYVETLFWRKRYIHSINDRNSIIKKAAQREAMNMPIQWTAADIIKLSMIQIHQFLKENNCKSQMLMQVHDELVFNMKADEFDFLKTNILHIMEYVIPSPIPLIVDIWQGKNWKEAK